MIVVILTLRALFCVLLGSHHSLFDRKITDISALLYLIGEISFSSRTMCLPLES